MWTDICEVGQNHLPWESIHRADLLRKSWYNRNGGATNYLCMPDNPDYLQYDSGVPGYGYVYGLEYDPLPNQPLNVNPNVDAHNVPCAVCMAVSRCSLLMIPGKTSCPVSWTIEYVGYLMSGNQQNALPTTLL